MGYLGVGPVFSWEWRRVSRQWWFFAMRSALVGGLLAALGAAWWSFASGPDSSVPRVMARVGEAFFVVVVLERVMNFSPGADVG